MILGEPTLQSFLDLLQADGCPFCGELPATMDVNGPNEIVLGCGHVVDTENWIDSHYQDREFDASELEGTNDG